MNRTQPKPLIVNNFKDCTHRPLGEISPFGWRGTLTLVEGILSGGNSRLELRSKNLAEPLAGDSDQLVGHR